MSKMSFPPGDEEFNLHQEEIQKRETFYTQPEFVLIDDRQGKVQCTYFGSDSSRQSNETFQKEDVNSKNSLSLRFICVLGFIFCLVFGLGIFIWSIVATFLAALSFFRNPALNQGAKSFWKMSIHTAIACFGFTLGMISPVLGLGLIALYFSLAGELMSEDFLYKIIRRSFNRI